MKKLALVVAVLAASVSAAPPELNGWGKATWGMTEEQVLAADPDAKHLEQGPSTLYMAPHGHGLDDWDSSLTASSRR